MMRQTGRKRHFREEEEEDNQPNDSAESEEEEEEEEEDNEEEESDYYSDGPEEEGNDDDEDASDSDEWSSEGESEDKSSRKRIEEEEEEEIDPNVPLFKLLQQRSESDLPLSHKQKLFQKKKLMKPKKSKSDSDSESGKKKRNKNAPAEMRSDRPVKRYRLDTNFNTVRKIIDPRFADYAGELSQTHYAKNYEFLDDIKQKEYETLQKKYKKMKNEEQRQLVKHEMNVMRQQLTERKLAINAMNKFEEYKKTEKEKQKTLGKKPYFLKNSQKRELLNEERFSQLKKEKRLKKFIEKKNKKIYSKEKRSLPKSRNAFQESP